MTREARTTGRLDRPRRWAALAGLLIAAALSAPPADAQSGRLMRLVVPFPAGGTTDTLARLVAQEISAITGQAVVVENRHGASTMIATEFVARAVPDGTTLLLTANTFVINPSVRSSVPYDPFVFEPLCLLVNSPQVFVVNSESPYKTLSAFVSAARAKPGDLNYAAVGPATTQHIAGELFKREAGINLLYVPFGGGAGAVNAILGNHVSAVLANYNEVMMHIAVGRLRPLAVASRARLAQLRDVPTFKEFGYRNIEAIDWFGTLAPPKTPRETLGQLMAQFKNAIETPEVREKLLKLGLFPVGACGDAFDAHIRTQYENYARVVKESNIRAE